LAYPLATLYVFQWLGYQELTLPMKRNAPLLYMQFADPRLYVVLALGLLVAALLITLWVENSRFGMSLLAIKQNEPAAEAAGIDAWRWKMLALMLSGAVAAVAGGLYAVVLLVVTTEGGFGMLVSAQHLTRRLFGGGGSLGGPVTSPPLPLLPPARGGDLLVLRDIGMSFGGLRALDGIDLVVPEGGLYGIIGPNGAGKTTLFNIINGFLPPDRGMITFSGAPITNLRPNQVCRRGVGQLGRAS